MSKKATLRVDKEIGIRIRLRRAQIGMSQAQLGSASGVTFRQIQKYENGTNRISVSRLNQLAKTLGVDPTFFLPEPDGHDLPKGLVPADKSGLELLSLFDRLKNKSMRQAILMLARSAYEHERKA